MTLCICILLRNLKLPIGIQLPDYCSYFQRYKFQQIILLLSSQWFEERCGMVDALDAALRRLHGAAEALAGGRRELATLAGGSARSAAALSGAEEHAALARALSQLADVQEKVMINGYFIKLRFVTDHL